MSGLSKIKLASGEELLVEVDDTPAIGVKPVALLPDGRIDLADALERVKGAAGQVVAGMKAIAVPPSSFELQFGIKLSASAGVILAKAGSEANFTIKLSWAK